jgi:hypothetical protein
MQASIHAQSLEKGKERKTQEVNLPYGDEMVEATLF